MESAPSHGVSPTTIEEIGEIGEIREKEAMMRLFRREYVIAILVSALIVLGLGLFVTDVAYAELKVTDNVYAWDEVASSYQNSMVVVTFDGHFEPFIHPISFDTDLYPQEFPPPFPPGAPTDDACFGTGVNTYTQYAGVMQWGVAHTDNNPAGAPGFVLSRNWKIVDCDRNGDGSVDIPGADADFGTTGTEVTEIPQVIFQVLLQDQVVPCSSATCQDEIVTTFYINLDTDCDGDISDEGYPAHETLCFYAEAQTPNLATWGGNPQGRVSAGGGDKTLNFNPQSGTTAVTLSSFAPSASGAFSTVLLALGVGGMVLLFWRARRRT
jgi:hypothetical protein